MSNEMDVKNGDLVHRCTGLLVYGRYHLFDQKLECGICDSPRGRDGRWRRCRCGKPLPWATKRRRRVAEECRSFGLLPYEKNTAVRKGSSRNRICRTRISLRDRRTRRLSSGSLLRWRRLMGHPRTGLAGRLDEFSCHGGAEIFRQFTATKKRWLPIEELVEGFVLGGVWFEKLVCLDRVCLDKRGD